MGVPWCLKLRLSPISVVYVVELPLELYGSGNGLDGSRRCILEM